MNVSPPRRLHWKAELSFLLGFLTLPAIVIGVSVRAPEVVLLGAQTDHCVAATVTGAIEAGLEVTVVSDAHSTWGFAGETADQIIARHNAAFVAAGAKLVTTQALIEAPAGICPLASPVTHH